MSTASTSSLHGCCSAQHSTQAFPTLEPAAKISIISAKKKTRKKYVTQADRPPAEKKRGGGKVFSFLCRRSSSLYVLRVIIFCVVAIPVLAFPPLPQHQHQTTAKQQTARSSANTSVRSPGCCCCCAVLRIASEWMLLGFR